MTARPRVIIEALQVRPNPAGTGRSILDLCAALAGRDRGFDFTVLAAERSPFGDLDAHPGWKIHECPQAGRHVLGKALFTQMKLPGLVRRLGGDLLHCQQFLVPLRCQCPVVATVHDLAWRRYPDTIEKSRLLYYRWLVPRSLNRADALCANSQATARDIQMYYPRASEKIQVTPFGTPLWAVRRMEGDEPPGDQPGQRYFLFVGTLEPRKNLPRLVDAYEAFLASEPVRQAAPDSVPKLILAGGRGWKESRLRSRMSSLQEQGRLEVLDYCGPERLWDLYRGAVALVFPSLHEGFGFPVLEAMASSLPVLTSVTGATAEVGGDAALLVDPENTREITAGLVQLAFDSDLRTRLAEAGPRRAREWTWERTSDLTCAVYRRLLDSGPGK